MLFFPRVFETTIALFHENEVRTKKNNFDVAQGSYDGAEISELIGIYVLHKIKESFGDMLIGLYRDDCLWVIEGTNSDIERKRKMIVKIFANCNLKLEDATPIQTGIDFLDAVFDLKNNSFEPYMKPRNEIRYVSIESNHPPMILKQISRIVEHRISTLSSSKEIFDQTIPPYQKAITDAGYQDILKYSATTNPKIRSKTARSREITWFNPPWYMQVTTNIGGLVLNLVDKHYPKNHSLSKQKCRVKTPPS